MRERFRKWLCRKFNLVRHEDNPPILQMTAPPSGWDDLGDLWDVRGKQTVWPRVVTSDAWRAELEPWFRQMLLGTFIATAQEKDPAAIVRLQERSKLLNEFLEVPRLQMARENAALDNARRSGDTARFAQMMERVNGR